VKRFALLALPASAALGLSLLLALIDPILSLWSLAALALGFAIQAAVLFLTRQGPKWLRWAPLGLLAVPLFMARSVRPHGFLWELEILFWLSLALSYLLGWAAAWGLGGKDHA